MKHHVIKKFILFFTVLIFAFGWVAFSIYDYGNQTVDIKTDAAVVLGAAVWEDKPSPVFQERINHAIKLYQQGKVDKIIFTGGKGKNAKITEAEAAKKYAEDAGVLSDDILLENASKITEENIAFAMNIAIEKGFSSLTLVSDPLHMKRAMTMVSNYPMKVYPSPTKTTRYVGFYSKSKFLLRETVLYIGYNVVNCLR